MTRLERLLNLTEDGKRELLYCALYDWASVGDSMIYDLTRVKEAFSIGTMSFEDFVEWDACRVQEVANEFVDWLLKEDDNKEWG